MMKRPMLEGALALVLAFGALLGVVGPANADLLVTSDPGNIRRYDNNGAFVGEFISGGPVLDGPSAIIYGPDRNVYVLDSSDRVTRYNGQSGVFIDIFVPLGSNGLQEAKDMVFGPDGNLYISANLVGGIGEGGSVMRFNGATGAFMGIFVANGAGTIGCNVLSEAMALVFGRDGNLYVGNDARTIGGCGTSYSIMRFNGQTGAYIDTPVPPNAQGLYDPNGMTVGPDGNIYFSSEGTSFTADGFGADNPNVIYRLNPTTTVLTQFVMSNGLLNVNGPFPPGTGLVEPQGIVFGPDGNLYVTSGDTAEVYRYNGTTGALLGVFVTRGSGGLQDPKGLVFLLGLGQVPIPTLSQWPLILLVLLLAAIGGYTMHGRRE